MDFHDISLRDKKGRKLRIQVVYQDEALIVMDKPAGIPVIPDRWQRDSINLVEIVSEQLGDPERNGEEKIWVVHRIDAETSGLVLFARSEEVHRRLNQAFMDGKVQKTYLALVRGVPGSPEGKIEYRLSHTASGRIKVDLQGKEAHTEYRVIERFRNFALLEVYPLTGRTHQIRVHLQAIGYPLAIDSKYGGKQRIQISDLKKIRTFPDEEVPSLMTRLTLHAWKLRFIHPVRLQEMQYTSDIPKDFQALLKSLRKWDRQGLFNRQ